MWLGIAYNKGLSFSLVSWWSHAGLHSAGQLWPLVESGRKARRQALYAPPAPCGWTCSQLRCSSAQESNDCAPASAVIAFDRCLRSGGWARQGRGASRTVSGRGVGPEQIPTAPQTGMVCSLDTSCQSPPREPLVPAETLRRAARRGEDFKMRARSRELNGDCSNVIRCRR